MPGVKGNSGGKKGRSGRRPLSIEAKRLMVIDKAWAVTEEALNSKSIELKDRAHIASPVVKSDMAKPIIIDQSTHEHHTLKIDLNTAEQSELVAALLGRTR